MLSLYFRKDTFLAKIIFITFYRPYERMPFSILRFEHYDRHTFSHCIEALHNVPTATLLGHCVMPDTTSY